MCVGLIYVCVEVFGQSPLQFEHRPLSCIVVSQVLQIAGTRLILCWEIVYDGDTPGLAAQTAADICAVYWQ